MRNKLIQIHCYLNVEDKKTFTNFAKQLDLPLSTVIRVAIRNYMSLYMKNTSLCERLNTIDFNLNQPICAVEQHPQHLKK